MPNCVSCVTCFHLHVDDIVAISVTAVWLWHLDEKKNVGKTWSMIVFQIPAQMFYQLLQSKIFNRTTSVTETQKHQCTMGFAMHIQEKKKNATNNLSEANIRYGKTIVLLLVQHLPNYVPWQLQSLFSLWLHIQWQFQRRQDKNAEKPEGYSCHVK